MIKRLIDRLKQPDLRSVWVMIGVIGITRYAIGLYLNDLRGPLGIAWIFICCPILVVVAVICAIVIFVLFRLYRRTRSLVPMAVLFAGIALAFLPPFPSPPPTPEVELFLNHRTDFERVVELARRGELKKAPNTAMGWLPPENYAYLSAASFMFAYQSDESGFRVEFVPYDFYYPIVYAEQTPRDPCNLSGGGTETKLDDHWYVCQVDWN